MSSHSYRALSHQWGSLQKNYSSTLQLCTIPVRPCMDHTRRELTLDLWENCTVAVLSLHV